MGSQLTLRRRSLVALGLIATATALTAAPAASAAPEPPAPAAPSECTADAIEADTSLALTPDVICSAGFAMGALAMPDPSTSGPSATAHELNGCRDVPSCMAPLIFHVTVSGWVNDGIHGAECAEDIGVDFMSPQTAATFAEVCDLDAWPEPPVVQAGDRGSAVMYVQIALVNAGFDEAVDGVFDDATSSAVQLHQSAYGLDPTGVVDAATHALLGTGPPAPGAPAPTTTSTTATTSTTSTTVPPPVGMAPGTPRPCTVEAVAADTRLPVDGIFECHAGWALGMLSTTCPPNAEYPDAECETADVFHVADDGWVHDGSFYAYCAEAIADGAGMSIHTAVAWSPICSGAAEPHRTNITPGTRGLAVEQLQIALVAVGYPLSVDGEYGPRTESAVRDFQQRNGLEVDGIAGPDTQIALGM